MEDQKNGILAGFITFFIFVLLFVLMYIFINKGLNKLHEINDNYRSMIGKEIIVKNDTLIILNYSLWDDTYTLNDGKKISGEYVNIPKYQVK